MTCVLDTCALIDLAAGQPDAVEQAEQADALLGPITAIGEYLAGADQTRRGQRLARWLTDFLADVLVAGLTVATATQYATLYRSLRQAGTMIPQNDLWIAATALEHHATLMTNDQHLRNVPGLKVVAW